MHSIYSRAQLIQWELGRKVKLAENRQARRDPWEHQEVGASVGSLETHTDFQNVPFLARTSIRHLLAPVVSISAPGIIFICS